MRFALFLAALILASTAATAQAQRPITHEDLWLMTRLAPPALSPDGRQAVLLVTEPAYDPKDQRADLWLVATDGRTAPRRLTSTAEPEGPPAFSHDGRRIAFSAQRSGDSAPQVYVLDLDGGEAVRVTELSTGARNPQFAPDGRSIAFISSVFPEAKNDDDSRRIAKERSERTHSARVYTGFPIRNWDRWLDERQQRLFVQALDAGSARDVLAGSALVRQPGFGGRMSDTGEELDYTWAPDGRSLVFSATTNRHTAAFAWTHADLYSVAIDGGEPRRLTGDGSLNSQDSWSRPTFAPDGRTLWAQRTPRTDRIYTATRLSAFAWPAMTPRAGIDPELGRAVNTFALSTDGRTVYFSAEADGLERIHAAQPGKKDRVLSTSTRGVYAGLVGSERGSQILVALYDSATEPPELVRIDPRTGGHTRLTSFSVARAAELDLAPVEHFRSTSPVGGESIHNMLVRPPGFDPSKKYPLFVLMHGGPHIMWRDTFFVRWNYHLIAQPGYVLLLTNYRGSTGFGEAFAQAIQGDPLKGPADEINDAADAAIARFPFIDGSRQCAGGASYGGHLANWLQGTTTRYRCLVSHAGLVNLEAQWGTSDSIFGREVTAGGPPWERGPIWSEQNPIRFGADFKTPTLVTIGELDYRVPLNNILEYWSALQRQQVESRLVVFPDENHWILKGGNSRYFYQELHDWLGRWLQDPRPAAEAAPN
jgi:dipeptidyl aminopeptidase/acylaminoacyl peptidase